MARRTWGRRGGLGLTPGLGRMCGQNGTTLTAEEIALGSDGATFKTSHWKTPFCQEAGPIGYLPGYYSPGYTLCQLPLDHPVGLWYNRQAAMRCSGLSHVPLGWQEDLCGLLTRA